MPINVLCLATYLTPAQAGAAQAYLAVVNALAAEPWARVTLFAYEADAAMLSPRVTVVRGREPKPGRFWWRFEHLLALRATVREFRRCKLPPADLVYTANTVLGMAYREVDAATPIVSHTGAVITKRELLEEGRGLPIVYRRLAAAAVDRLENRSYRTPRWTHIVSTRLVARQREQHFGLPDGFFRICPYGVDQSRFDRSAPHRDVRTALGIPRDAFVVATVARLVDWKNVGWVIEAVSQMSDDVHHVVVGDGPAAAELRARAAATRAKGRIHFVGHTDPAPHLFAADAFALPSAIESFGMVYAEAMLMGLPCVGLRNDPPRVLSSAQDVIPEGKAGYCVSTVDELRRRLEELAADRELRERMGAYGYELVRCEYSTEHYLEVLGRIMQDDFHMTVLPEAV
jgi:glycosyltransferase involved in cell wall biosynthesis